jgi:hypothetical protein
MSDMGYDDATFWKLLNAAGELKKGGVHILFFLKQFKNSHLPEDVINIISSFYNMEEVISEIVRLEQEAAYIDEILVAKDYFKKDTLQSDCFSYLDC